MTPPRRLLPAAAPAVGLALLLPALFGLASWLPLYAMAALDADHRAVAWIDGPAPAMARAVAAAGNDPVFDGGILRPSYEPRPADCADDALPLYFEVQRDDLAQPTRHALEELVAAAGARVCAGNRFVLNVPPQPGVEPARWLAGEARQLLVLVVLPGGLVLLAVAAPFGRAARTRLRGETPPRWQQPMVLGAAAAIALCALAAWSTSGVVPGWQRADATGLSPAFALHEIVLYPLLHQVAFRSWVFAHLQAWLPLPVLAAVAIAVQVLAATPGDAASAATALLVAALGTGAYLATRRLLPGAVLHALAVALMDARLVAG